MSLSVLFVCLFVYLCPDCWFSASRASKHLLAGAQLMFPPREQKHLLPGASFLLFIFLSSGSKRTTRRTRMWLGLLSWISAADRCNGLEHKPWKGARSTWSKDLLISPSSSTPFQLFAKCTVPIFRPHLDPPAPTWMETLGHLHLGQF